ncbi:MAG: hypothetical protein Q9191_007272 [Dirinaria sp. TL-2023a]
MSDGLEDMLNKVIVSEDDIARQQVEEDLRVYGSRPEPPDAVDMDESSKLANLPPKRSPSEFEAAIGRPAKARKKEEKQAFNYEAVTAMDWNSGASPLDAWLNQSAVPSTAANLVSPPGPEIPDKTLTAQEEEEIKVFRNVHLALAPGPKEDDKAVDEFDGLELGAQIYGRNIRDRYPRLPTYLTRRLAQANFKRSERLRSERPKMKQLEIQDAAQSFSSAEKPPKADGLEPSMAQTGVDISLRDTMVGEEIPLPENDVRHARVAAIARRRTQLRHRIISLETIEELSRCWKNFLIHAVNDLQNMKVNHCVSFYRYCSPKWIRVRASDTSIGQSEVCFYIRRYGGLLDSPRDEAWRSSAAEALARIERKRLTLTRYCISRWAIEFEEIPGPDSAERKISYLRDDLGKTEDDIRDLQNETEAEFNQIMNDIHEKGFEDTQKFDSLIKNIRICEYGITKKREKVLEIADDVEQYQRRQPENDAYGSAEIPSLLKPDTLPPTLGLGNQLSQTESILWTIAGHEVTKHHEVDEFCNNVPRLGVPQETRHTEASGLELYPKKDKCSSSNFWTGGTAITTCSPESSVNSSLRGRPTLDPQEQNPVFLSDNQSGSSASLKMLPALPPPPVELGRVKSFYCDICGQHVQVERRLEWQKHVISDLRPYLCTFPDCATPEHTYASRSSVLNHEILVHELEGQSRDVVIELESHPSKENPVVENTVHENELACLFCGEMLRKSMLDERARHIGRHMEEIAFSVVTKPYEDWDFYTDSSAKSNREVYQTKQATDVANHT